MASLQRFVPATCPMKFNKLNSARHVAGTKYPTNWCCTIIKVSVHTRGRVAASYPWDMYPQHFHVCANVVTLSLFYVAATRPCYMSPQCVLHKFYVAAACRCDMSLRHDPSCLPTFNLLCIHKGYSQTSSDTEGAKTKSRYYGGVRIIKVEFVWNLVSFGPSELSSIAREVSVL